MIVELVGNSSQKTREFNEKYMGINGLHAGNCSGSLRGIDIVTAMKTDQSRPQKPGLRALCFKIF